MKEANLVLIAAMMAIVGCAPRTVLVDLEHDKAIVQSQHANNEQIRRTAEEGCNVHNRTAVAISYSCLDNYCIQKRTLFACKERSASSPGTYGVTTTAPSTTASTTTNTVTLPPPPEPQGVSWQGTGADSCGESYAMALTVTGSQVDGNFSRAGVNYTIGGTFDESTGAGSGRMGKASSGQPGPRQFAYNFARNSAGGVDGQFAVESSGACRTTFRLS